MGPRGRAEGQAPAAPQAEGRDANVEYILEMKGICKSFPGVQALDAVTFRVRPGTVHSLMGENGAGKSTLMKCLFGIYHEDAGEIFIQGERVKFDNPRQALEHGVAMVHQELNQVLKRSVMENIWLGRFPKKLGLVDHRKIYADTKAIFTELQIDVDPKQVMGALSVSQRQMVEIAKAVSYHSSIIVLDEPTSSLTDTEVNHLFRIIRMLKARGCGIVYISHRMEEILSISDEVTIMRDGKWVATRKAQDLSMDAIIKLMVGRELTNRFPKKDNVPGEVVLKVAGLTALYQNVKDVSFELRRGEILGLAGLAGAGRTELLETLFGVAALKEGSVTYLGKPIKNASAKKAVANGFAMLTEERRATGVFNILSIRENMTVAALRGYHSPFFISDKRLKQDTQRMVDAMRVKTPTQKTKIMSLSGGNQQKVILGRWLLINPDILLLDEPTRGIDVGSKYEIYQLMIDLTRQGKSILMASSEMPELFGVCDRILVMSGGRLSGEVDPKEATQETVMALAAKYV